MTHAGRPPHVVHWTTCSPKRWSVSFQLHSSPSASILKKNRGQRSRFDKSFRQKKFLSSKGSIRACVVFLSFRVKEKWRIPDSANGNGPTLANMQVLGPQNRTHHPVSRAPGYSTSLIMMGIGLRYIYVYDPIWHGFFVGFWSFFFIVLCQIK